MPFTSRLSCLLACWKEKAVHYYKDHQKHAKSEPVNVALDNMLVPEEYLAHRCMQVLINRQIRFLGRSCYIIIRSHTICKGLVLWLGAPISRSRSPTRRRSERSNRQEEVSTTSINIRFYIQPDAVRSFTPPSPVEAHFSRPWVLQTVDLP